MNIFTITLLNLLVSTTALAQVKDKQNTSKKTKFVRDGYTGQNIARHIFTGKCGGIAVIEENGHLLNIHFFRMRVLDIKNDCSTTVTLRYPYEINRLENGKIELVDRILQPHKIDLSPAVLTNTIHSTIKIPITFLRDRSEGLSLEFENTHNIITWQAMENAQLLAKNNFDSTQIEESLNGSDSKPKHVTLNTSVEAILNQITQSKVSIKDVAAHANTLEPGTITYTSTEDIIRERELQQYRHERDLLRTQIEIGRIRDRESARINTLESTYKEPTALTVARGVTRSAAAGIATYGIISILKGK